MTKEAIDKYFTVNHKQILEYCTACLAKAKLYNEEDPSYLLSETYLFMLKKQELISDEVELKKFISNFVYKNTVSWVNSQYRELGSRIRQLRSTTYTDSHDKEDECILDFLLFNEATNSDVHQMATAYYHQCTDAALRSYFRICFVEKKGSFRKFAEHIGRSRGLAERCINDLKADMLRFKSEYFERQKHGL